MKKLYAIPLILLLLLTACEDQGAKLAEGYKAYDAEEFEKAFTIWKSLAENGNAEASYNVAVMYDNGVGVSQSSLTALNWYHQAGEKGHAKAQYKLGRMYDERQGYEVPSNSKESIRWLRKAALQGHAEAQYYLGILYQGAKEDIPENLVQAYMWASLARANGGEFLQYYDIIEVIGKKISPIERLKAQELARLCWESNYKNCG